MAIGMPQTYMQLMKLSLIGLEYIKRPRTSPTIKVMSLAILMQNEFIIECTRNSA